MSSEMDCRPDDLPEQPLYDVVQPHSHDVLSGRGVATNRHEGNTKFRSLVALNKVRAPVKDARFRVGYLSLLRVFA